jgi:hypothetical protein
MDNYKMRVKIGTSEFEAEGQEEAVRADYQAFLLSLAKQAVETKPEAQAVTQTITEYATPRETAENADNGSQVLEQIRVLFDYNPKRRIVSLRFPTQGADRVWKALLLTLYGYRKLAGEDEVPVTLLKTALAQTGLSVPRVDRVAAPLLREGLILKGGKAKGGKYRLTTPGISRAESEARVLMEQLR